MKYYTVIVDDCRDTVAENDLGRFFMEHGVEATDRVEIYDLDACKVLDFYIDDGVIFLTDKNGEIIQAYDVG